jgi:pimeloyl-ACP methyl ester carboxylesterase
MGKKSLEIEKSHTSIDGSRMRFLKTGSGPDLVLLHGLLGTASAWEPVFADLAAQSTLYAPDALGIGESDRVPGLDARLDAQAERLLRFMDAAGIHEADLLATSHGGAVAIAFAANHPDRVRSLLLHAPANPFSRICDAMVRFYCTPLGAWFAHRVPTMPRSMQSLALGRMYGDPAQVKTNSLDKYVSSLEVPGTIAYVLEILRHWFHDMEALREALRRIRTVPVLLLWGDHDRAVSLDSAREFAACFDQVDLRILPGIGHLPFEECPELFARLVNSYLGGLRKRACHQSFLSRESLAG